MPPKVKTTAEDIINSAYEIVREGGMEKLTARNVAQRLGTSVQPIFRTFTNMEDLEFAVMEKIKSVYREYIMNSVSIEDTLLGTVAAYIQFAKEENNLFKILNMSDRYRFQDTKELSSGEVNEEIVKAIAQMEDVTPEEAAFLYQVTYFTAHGIASFVATNHCEFTKEQINLILESVFDGVVLKLKSEK